MINQSNIMMKDNGYEKGSNDDDDDDDDDGDDDNNDDTLRPGA